MSVKLQNQAQAPVKSFFTPVQNGLLRRKCACTGSAGQKEHCHDCSNDRQKLKTATRNPEIENRNSRVVPSIVYDVLSSPGQPLDTGSRAFMEPRFGHDFSHVRVHADGRAAESARAIEALAYTVGNDIVFGSAQYAPQTTSGRRLLTHEMTHVLQQRVAPPGRATYSSLHIGAPGDAFEREAEMNASAIAPTAAQELSKGEVRVSREPQESTSYREDMEATELGLYEEYQRDCTGIGVMKRLQKDEEFTPLERVRSLERKVKNMPKVLNEREEKKSRSQCHVEPLPTA